MKRKLSALILALAVTASLTACADATLPHGVKKFTILSGETYETAFDSAGYLELNSVCMATYGTRGSDRVYKQYEKDSKWGDFTVTQAYQVHQNIGDTSTDNYSLYQWVDFSGSDNSNSLNL